MFSLDECCICLFIRLFICVSVHFTEYNVCVIPVREIWPSKVQCTLLLSIESTFMLFYVSYKKKTKSVCVCVCVWGGGGRGVIGQKYFRVNTYKIYHVVFLLIACVGIWMQNVYVIFYKEMYLQLSTIHNN